MHARRWERWRRLDMGSASLAECQNESDASILLLQIVSQLRTISATAMSSAHTKAGVQPIGEAIRLYYAAGGGHNLYALTTLQRLGSYAD